VEGEGADRETTGAAGPGPGRHSPAVLIGRETPVALLLALLALCGGRRAPAERSLSTPDTLYTMPRDPTVYTQGLEIRDGVLYESSGGYGRSAIHAVDPSTGRILSRRGLPDDIFAEGLTFHGNSGYLLTWREGLVLLFDPISLEVTDTLRLVGEGWGVCSDGRNLYTSNGSAALVVRSPRDMAPLDTLTVALDGVPRPGLNELEWTESGILANRWGTDRILRISPATGEVLEVMDMSRFSESGLPGRDVMNGLAAMDDSLLLVTGKLWHRYLVFPLPGRSGR